MFDLKFRIKSDEQIPDDIRKLLKLAEGETLSDAQLQRLQEFIQARDTLVVWRNIAEQAFIDLDLPQAFVNAHAAITKAEEFSAWLEKEENHDRLENLQSLDLRYFCLTSLPPEIGQLTSLQELWLDYNHLTSLPPQIWRLGSLHRLDLSGNQLTTLPPEIGQLTSLRDLWLNINHLTSIPSEIGQLTSLRELGLHNNCLTSIPEEIQTLPNLRIFRFRDNPIPSAARLKLSYRFSLSDMLSNPQIQVLAAISSVFFAFLILRGSVLYKRY